MGYKDLTKRMYESVKKGWRNFWDDDVARGLTFLILFALALQGPLYKQPENKLTEYMTLESYKKLKSTPIIQQKNKYLQEFINYINGLPKEQKDSLDSLFGQYMRKTKR